MVLGGGVLAFLVFPKIEEMFAVMGGGMLSAAANIATLKQIVQIVLFALLGMVLVVTAYIRFGSRNPALKLVVDKCKLNVPFAGAYLSYREGLNFCFAMELLLGGGLALDASLAEAEQALSNAAWRQGLAGVRAAIRKGGGLCAAFRTEAVFPENMKRWIELGEKTGSVEKVFAKLRIYFQGEIEKRTKIVIDLIEPALIVFLGAVIMVVVAAVVLPLFSMFGNIL
jgi:type II secretory pathway component PulF